MNARRAFATLAVGAAAAYGLIVLDTRGIGQVNVKPAAPAKAAVTGASKPSVPVLGS